MRRAQGLQLEKTRSLSSEILDMSVRCKKQLQAEDAQNEFKIKQKLMIIQTDISDFVVIETGESEMFKFLDATDWKKIISQQSHAGYNAIDIHVSLLTQNLDFVERRKVWLFFCKNYQLQGNNKGQDYRSLLKKKCKFTDQIIKDVTRSSNAEFFLKKETQETLQNILMAYANYDPELGYCQGMNFVAAHILQCYDMRENDEQVRDFEIMDIIEQDVFTIFANIMIEKNWRSIFMEGFPGLTRAIKKLEEKMQAEIRPLYEHFFNEGVDFPMFFTNYYMTLMMYGVDIEFARVVLDLFLFEGEEIIHKFLLAMLRYQEDKLIKMKYEQLYVHCKEGLIPPFTSMLRSHKNKRDDLTKLLINLGLINIQREENPENEISEGLVLGTIPSKRLSIKSQSAVKSPNKPNNLVQQDQESQSCKIAQHQNLSVCKTFGQKFKQFIKLNY